MRALILSDIHSNIDALEAVPAAAPAHDVVWNLGDTVGYGAAPNAVIDCVRDLGKVHVRGNHDRGCSGLVHADEFNPIALAAVRWTQRELSSENMQWLRKAARGPLHTTEDVLCVHGSPLHEDHYVLSQQDAISALAATEAPLIFFGHTHVQGGFAISADGDGFTLTPSYASPHGTDFFDLKLRQGTRYMLNPGSIGQPRDRDWRAAFALYDSLKRSVIFGRVPYMVQAAQIRILRAGLPEALATRLRVGR